MMELLRLVDDWNEHHPVGTQVRYWKGVREGDGRISRTRSRAQVLSGHTAVVWVEAEAGCIALSHVEETPSHVEETPGTAEDEP